MPIDNCFYKYNKRPIVALNSSERIEFKLSVEASKNLDITNCLQLLKKR